MDAGGNIYPIAKTALAAAVLAAVWFLAMRTSTRRDTRRILQEKFATAIEPDGTLTACKIRFPIEEAATPCLVRATRAGWYMVSPAEALAKRPWSSGVPLLEEPVLIPWTQLEYRRTRFPFLRSLRFDIPSAGVTFFVRKSVALALLREADRPLPTQ